MASIEEELRLDEEDNLRELAFIREQIPFDAKKHYSDESILYMLDLIVDYYYESGILESNEEEIDIDMEEVANYVCRKAKENGVTNFLSEYVLFVVQADLDYQEQNL
jgi:DNA-directed RNA polymerase specialized sigma54-like protein